VTYRAAIIGCGRIAGGYDPVAPDPGDPEAWSATHAGAYRLCPDTTLIAVSDPDAAARAQFAEKWGVDGLYADYRDMLAAETPDIVSLCLPTPLHEDAFAAALDAGAKAVFLEKPISDNVESATRMTARAGDVPVSVNFSRRFNPDYADVAAALARGEYGRPLNAVFRYTKGLIVNGSHHIDTARWFFGEPVEAATVKIADPDAADPGVDFRLTFANGFDAYFLHVPDAGYVFFDVEILLERGRLRIAQRGHRIAFDPAEAEPHFGLFDIIQPAHAKETGWRNATTRAVVDLVDCLQTGRQPSCTLNDGLRTAEIIETLLRDTP